jgi:hypothetical protein
MDCPSSAGPEICDCAEVASDYKLYECGMHKKDKNNHCGVGTMCVGCPVQSLSGMLYRRQNLVLSGGREPTLGGDMSFAMMRSMRATLKPRA